LRQLSFLLVHGAGETPSVWAGWDGEAIDLQAGLNVAEASMLNYEAAVACDAGLVLRPLCLIARGMGALAAMLAARRIGPDALVLIEPWPTTEVGGSEHVEVAGSRPESEFALTECRAGISVPSLTIRTLVARGPALAAYYGAEELADEGASEAVAAWARSFSASRT
jgi:hypothetical protein